LEEANNADAYSHYFTVDLSLVITPDVMTLDRKWAISLLVEGQLLEILPVRAVIRMMIGL
jgi:hypothetical protein